MEFNMDKYGTNITTEEVTKKLSDDIIDLIEKNKDKVIALNFQKIKLLSTISARSVFKPIAEKYNVDNLFLHIELLNVNKDLQVIVNHALNSLVQES